jgi:peroxiredoxin
MAEPHACAPPSALDREAILAGLTAPAAAAYGEFVNWPAHAGLAQDALRVGDAAPDFLLPDANGRLVASRELRRNGPIVLSFIRGDWCAFCRAQLQAWHAALPAVQALGARLLVVTPDVGPYAREAIRRDGLDGLDLLADLYRGLSLSFGVVYGVPDALRAGLLAQGVDLAERHGAAGWLLPVPATYVIDKAGTVRSAHVEPDYSHRQSPEAVLKVLWELAATPPPLGEA